MNDPKCLGLSKTDSKNCGHLLEMNRRISRVKKNIIMLVDRVDLVLEPWVWRAM